MLLWKKLHKICAIIDVGRDFMYQVEIIKLDHQGRGIGKIDNKIIFVLNALPNEVIETKIILEKKNYYEGKTNKILMPSKDRVEPICPYFNECGGCQFLNVSYEKSLEFKQNKVRDILNRYLNLDIKINPIIKSDENLYYRNKVTFQVSNDIGFYKNKTNELISVDCCYIADKNINKIYKAIRENISLTNVKQVIIKSTKYTNESMIIFKTNDLVDQDNMVETLKNLVTSIYVNDNLIYGENNIVENLLDFSFYISPTSFFQVNTKQAEKLYLKTLEYANITNNDLVLDLYCGTGTIGLLASKNAKKVIGIELNKEAIKDANKNKKLNSVTNIQFYSGDVGKILLKNNYNPDIVIVDPPRAGLDNTAINQIIKIKPKRLVYVSCDLMTLTRDLKTLSKDYEIIELTPVDMFPMTSHVECVCIMDRK